VKQLKEEVKQDKKSSSSSLFWFRLSEPIHFWSRQNLKLSLGDTFENCSTMDKLQRRSLINSVRNKVRKNFYLSREY